MTTRALAFGIGSIFFEIDSTDTRDWLPSVTSTLEGIPSISKLETTFRSNILVKGIRHNFPVTGTIGSKYPATGIMKFDITIPTRFQKGLRVSRRNADSGELFTVTTIYE